MFHKVGRAGPVPHLRLRGQGPEIDTLATTVDAWQQANIAAIDTGPSNARSEGDNRIVKHMGRVAFAFRNRDNQHRRIRWCRTRRTRPVPSVITARCPR